MDYNVRILPTAERELDEAVGYLAAYSKSAAASLLDEYANQLDLLKRKIVSYALSRMPKLATLGYRTALVGDYLFLCYVDDETLVVAHFFHQRQDYAALVRSRKTGPA